MIEFTTERIYHWDDIQTEICKIMQIDEKHFRDYHEVVGGDYKDLWHVAMESYVVPESMSNGSVVTMFGIDEGSIPTLVKRKGEWTEEFFKAYQKIMMELDPEDSGLNVRFSW